MQSDHYREQKRNQADEQGCDSRLKKSFSKGQLEGNEAT